MYNITGDIKIDTESDEVTKAGNLYYCSFECRSKALKSYRVSDIFNSVSEGYNTDEEVKPVERFEIMDFD